MEASKPRKRASCAYDEERKAKTLEALNASVRRQRRRKEHETKPITVHSLSVDTGIRHETIKKYPSIMKILEEEKARFHKEVGTVLKSSVLKVQKLDTFDKAVNAAIILNDSYNETVEMYHKALRKISEIELENSRLHGENIELKHIIETMRQEKGCSDSNET